MPWKNGRGTTDEILIHPNDSSFLKADYGFRLSSAPINEDCEFSQFQNKMRILVPIKGSGFCLNSNVYEKFDVAHFSGDDPVVCQLLTDPVLDLGLIYDPHKWKVQPRILQLKSDFSFGLEATAIYLVTVLSGSLIHLDNNLSELETLHISGESICDLKVQKSTILFLLKLEQI